MQHNLKKNILSKPNLLTLDIKRQFNQFNFVMELPENKWQGDICLAKKPLMWLVGSLKQIILTISITRWGVGGGVLERDFKHLFNNICWVH